MVYRVSQIKMPLDYSVDGLKAAAAGRLGISEENILGIRIVRKSVDARNKKNVFFTFGVDVEVKNGIICAEEPHTEEKYSFPTLKAVNCRVHPVIVGAGPAGLFAAYTLAMAGTEPVIIERGSKIEKRVSDTENFFQNAVLDEESNIQFGEGGAGTFSDGKLTTGIKDIRIKKVLELFYEMGAPEEILYEAKPHIGTDILRKVIVNIRKTIIKMGGKFYFDTKLADINIEKNVLASVTVEDMEGKRTEIPAPVLILAVGHSARDTYKMLFEKNIKMIQKPFSVGVRIEHKRDFIDRAQYGDFSGHPALGAADYKFAVHLKNGRGVYTFCMCPGGYVVPSASEKEAVCVNGMSEYKRDGENSNSAVLVSVSPEDFKTDSPMEGIEFQRHIEKNAFNFGGGGYKAPVQLADDFIKNIKSTGLANVEPSYSIGYTLTNLSCIFPGFISDSLREGLFLMNKNINGFTRNGAVITAAETRSSSPLRIVRNENFESSISGIFPCGEGAGYAGGIMSSAVDGIKTAEKVMESIINIGKIR